MTSSRKFLIGLDLIHRDSRKSQQKMVKNMAQFCENCKNRGKITAVYIAANC